MPELKQDAQKLESFASTEPQLIEAIDSNGGSTPAEVHGRILCKPQGGSGYYEDTRNGDGTVTIGAQVKPWWEGTVLEP